ncbi:MAG: GGDEF domain-containing protein [Myxococcota bacterium]|nr:GGDEF domain-containing protein [Myxococcota bacterium]
MSSKRERDHTQQHVVVPAVIAGERRGVLTVLAGPQPGRLIALTDEELTIGRSDESTIALDDDSLSRRHVRLFRAHQRYFVEDLQSTNGSFVDGARITVPVALEDGMRVQLGATTVMRFAMRDQAEVEATRRVYEATVRDRLTGVFNRHFLDERLLSEMSYAKRHGTTLSVLFVDADHFKAVNDTHGHAGGDEVLRQIASLLQRTMRSEDVVARYGGEEFVVVVRGIAAIGVLAVAERLRAGVEALRIEVAGAHVPVTISVGVATQSPESDHAGVEELLAVADAALYRAKASGRNRVFLA